MKILVADDDAVVRTIAQTRLSAWGYHVTAVGDGAAALELLSAGDAPNLALLDWMMPGLDGPEICRRLRARPNAPPLYLILATARGGAENIADGLEAGADDFLTKPLDPRELRARLGVGVRVMGLEQQLCDRVHELEKARASLRELKELLPICSYCHQVRDDGNYWQRLDQYLMRTADVAFSHGMCPTCQQIHWPEMNEDAEPGCTTLEPVS